MPVSKRLRYEILRRDSHTCRYCGASAPDVKLTVDHVVPVALGGTDDATNLVTACQPCNAGKTSSAPDAALMADVDEKALIWSRAMAKAAQKQTDDRIWVEFVLSQFGEHWKTWRLDRGTSLERTLPLPDDWRSSIEQLVVQGLGDGDVIYAIDAAMRSQADKRFNYCCGVLNRLLEDRRAIARDLIEKGEA